jgi:hypothetical protein
MNIKTHIEIIPDNHHWRITARPLTLDFNNREFSILRRLTGLYTTKVTAYSVEDFGGATQHARCSCADLDEIGTYWFTKNRNSVRAVITLARS